MVFFWVFFVFANILWITLPLMLLLKALGECTSALRKAKLVGKKGPALATKGKGGKKPGKKDD